MNLPKPECCRWDRYIGELTKGGWNFRTVPYYCKTNLFSQWQCIVFVIVFSMQELNAYCRIELCGNFTPKVSVSWLIMSVSWFLAKWVKWALAYEHARASNHRPTAYSRRPNILISSIDCLAYTGAQSQMLEGVPLLPFCLPWIQQHSRSTNKGDIASVLSSTKSPTCFSDNGQILETLCINGGLDWHSFAWCRSAQLPSSVC